MTGTGVISNPWDLATALSSPAVGPGDTLLLRGGTYTAAAFTSSVAGLANKRITIKAYPGERPIIDANVRVLGSYTRWEGLEFCSLGFTDRSSVEMSSGPTDINGHRLIDPIAPLTQIINCIIRDAHQGLSGTGQGSEFYGNLIYYIGWDYPDNTYGHGIYPHNSTPVMRIADNLIFDNFGYGLHAYADTGQLDNITVDGNTFFNNGSPRSEGKYVPNIHIGGHGAVANPVVRDNVSYYPTAGQVGLNRVGYDDDFPVTGARITGNLFVGEFALTLKNCVPVEFTGNELYGLTEGFEEGDYLGNTYGVAAAVPARVRVRANEYQSGRGHVTIINPTSIDSVSVNVAAVLAAGSAYRLRNAQDYYNDAQTGTVAGNGTIAVDMRASQRTVAAPVGWTPSPTTFPEFGCLVLEPA